MISLYYSPSNNSRKQDREALQIPLAESGSAHCQDGGSTGGARGTPFVILKEEKEETKVETGLGGAWDVEIIHGITFAMLTMEHFWA